MTPAIKIIREVCSLALGTLFPAKCLQCSLPLWGLSSAFLCPDCENDIQWIHGNACKKCGSPAGPHASLGKGCSNCVPSNLAFTSAIAATRFLSPAKELVHHLKYRHNRRLANPLAEAMIKRFRKQERIPRLDIVLPVPLHIKRQRERGYNQSELLASLVSKEINVPLKPEYIIRNRNTPAQASLTRKDRTTNIAGAFEATVNLDGSSILLIDDVMTTGATASECSRALRKAGAAHIYVCTFAR